MANDSIAQRGIPEVPADPPNIMQRARKKVSPPGPPPSPPSPAAPPDTVVAPVVDAPAAGAAPVKEHQPQRADTRNDLGSVTPPVRSAKGVGRCVYFRDANQVAELEAWVARHPRSSISALVQQLASAALEAAKKQGPDKRMVRVEMDLVL